MSTLRSISITLAMSLTMGVAYAEQFDGSQPLECTAIKGHDCLSTETNCGPLKPESDKPKPFLIDAAKKQIRSPYRTSLLPIAYTTTNRESLVLLGADLLFAWSALINKTTGALTLSVSDRKGAYVVFGQCKVAGTK
jgi:hypothetical protein